jgi:hypothetical protein
LTVGTSTPQPLFPDLPLATVTGQKIGLEKIVVAFLTCSSKAALAKQLVSPLPRFPDRRFNISQGACQEPGRPPVPPASFQTTVVQGVVVQYLMNPDGFVDSLMDSSFQTTPSFACRRISAKS